MSWDGGDAPAVEPALPNSPTTLRSPGVWSQRSRRQCLAAATADDVTQEVHIIYVNGSPLRPAAFSWCGSPRRRAGREGPHRSRASAARTHFTVLSRIGGHRRGPNSLRVNAADLGADLDKLSFHPSDLDPTMR